MAFPTVTVELGLAIDPTVDVLIFDDPSRGLFDIGQFAPLTVWTDVSAYVLEIHTSDGRSRPLEHYRAGTGTVVLDNATGNFSPHNLSGAYVSGGVTLLQPERRMRIRITHGGTTYDWFHGFIDSFAPSWDTPNGAKCVIRATDYLKVLAKLKPAAASSPVGASEDTGARIDRVLDAYEIPGGDRDIDTGKATLQATTLANPALNEIMQSADSELGAVYVAGDGRITFDNKHAIYENTRSNTVQGTFGDSPGSAELIYEDLDVAPFDDELVKNAIAAARVGGATVTREDAASQAAFFEQPHTKTDLLLETDDAVGYWADHVLDISKDAEQRINALTLVGSEDDTTLFTQMLGRKIRDRIRVIRRPSSGDALDKQLFIEGRKLDVTIGFEWKLTWPTSSATGFNGFIFDHSTFGQFDGTGVLIAA